MRKRLDKLEPLQPLPDGTRMLPLWKTNPIALHQLLVTSYANGGGSVGDFDSWFWPLVEDEEFHPDLVLVAADDAGTPIGLAQCWTSGFLKDLVVHPSWRDRRVGSVLLQQAFHVLEGKGLQHMDLKVLADNIAAQRFYARHGMVGVD